MTLRPACLIQVSLINCWPDERYGEGLPMVVAQGIPLIDAEIAEKGHL